MMKKDSLFSLLSKIEQNKKNREFILDFGSMLRRVHHGKKS